MSRSGAAGQILYRVLTWLVSPLVAAHLLWRSSHDGGWQYFKERLGYTQVPTKNLSVIWVHAASVGEINTAALLLRAIITKWPTTRLLVTTNTPTGKAALLRHNLPGTECVYLPLDYSSALKRFFCQHNIRCGIIIETEVWPMLYELANVPLVIVNGRLSQRTMKVTKSVFKKIFERAAENIHTVLARSEKDARNFEKIGVSPHKVKSLGNLKYSIATDLKIINPAEPPLVRNYCLLASTHANEELDIATHWLRHSHDELLVIAPRHPKRGAAIEKQLSTLGVSISVRSRNEAVTEETRLYLADTLGEMTQWFMFASDIFMGGSLVPHGGHNMLEPAQLGKSVITGPHTHNFGQEVEMLRKASAIRQAQSAVDVVQLFAESLDNTEHCTELGRRALNVIKQNQHVVDDYLDALSPFLHEV